MTIGERIKRKRIELNMSQDELAKKVGYKSRSSIQKIECARNLPLPKVEKMAVALECTPASLMGWEDDNREQTVYDQLLNHYIKNESDRKLLERYHNLSPEARKLIDLVIEDDLRKNGRPD